MTRGRAEVLLNLAEFMEQNEKPLSMDIRKLAELAESCFAYAKALHYRELEYASNPNGAVEHIIIINTALQQPEAGTVNTAGGIPCIYAPEYVANKTCTL